MRRLRGRLLGLVSSMQLHIRVLKFGIIESLVRAICHKVEWRSLFAAERQSSSGNLTFAERTKLRETKSIDLLQLSQNTLNEESAFL